MVIYKTSNELITDLLLMYCEGKGVLWNAYFGWRKTQALPDGSNLCTFKIPKRIQQMAEKVAKRYE